MNNQTKEKKTASLARNLTTHALTLDILAIFCTIAVSTFLGISYFGGKIALTQYIVFMVLYVVVIFALAAFAATRISRRIASPVTEVSTCLRGLNSGHFSSMQVTGRKVKIREINELETSVQTMVRQISGYINNVDQSLDRIAKGDLSFEITEDYVGDFTRIKNSMNGILTSLNTMMKNIESVSGEVLSVSEQVASNSQALAQGATEQASAVEELVSTINGISTRVSETAEHAGSANEKAGMVRSQITSSNEQMQTLIGAMNEINDTSNQVAKIVKIIEDIAFQTNILALNAAVEAARAGVNGKSFAVVADEVKNLATKSAAAAEDTTKLIKNTIAAVENGMSISTQTADLLAGVVTGVDDVADIVSAISAASAEESSSINQVVQGLDQVSTVVQTNSATAEESAAVSHQLADSAKKLEKIVKILRLKS
jgi:methyl-accepting chemotaxis protein